MQGHRWVFIQVGPPLYNPEQRAAYLPRSGMLGCCPSKMLKRMDYPLRISPPRLAPHPYAQDMQGKQLKFAEFRRSATSSLLSRSHLHGLVLRILLHASSLSFSWSKTLRMVCARAFLTSGFIRNALKPISLAFCSVICSLNPVQRIIRISGRILLISRERATPVRLGMV